MKNLLAVFLIIVIFLVGCKTWNKSQKGAVIGAAGGAVAGAVVGKVAGNRAVGAIIGGTVGELRVPLVGKSGS